jgi:hypothetical protein
MLFHINTTLRGSEYMCKLLDEASLEYFPGVTGIDLSVLNSLPSHGSCIDEFEIKFMQDNLFPIIETIGFRNFEKIKNEASENDCMFLNYQ